MPVHAPGRGLFPTPSDITCTVISPVPVASGATIRKLPPFCVPDPSPAPAGGAFWASAPTAHANTPMIATPIRRKLMRVRTFLTSGQCNNLKSAAFSAEMPGMPTGAPELWFLLGLITLGAIVSVLLTIAKRIQHERDIVDLRLRVVQVRRNYAARLGQKHVGEVVEVASVGETPTSKAA
jgi:hypothetical protein